VIAVPPNISADGSGTADCATVSSWDKGELYACAQLDARWEILPPGINHRQRPDAFSACLGESLRESGLDLSKSRDGTSRRLLPILGHLHLSIETGSPSLLTARRGVAPRSRIHRCFRKDLAGSPRMSATVRRVEVIVTSEHADSVPRSVGVLP
jgi:hypothetical protein